MRFTFSAADIFFLIGLTFMALSVAYSECWQWNVVMVYAAGLIPFLAFKKIQYDFPAELHKREKE